MPSVLLGGFLLIVRATINKYNKSRVDNKLRETVRFAIKYFHPLRMPSAGNASAESGVCKVARDFPANRKAKRSNKRCDQNNFNTSESDSMQNPLYPFSSHPEKEWQKTERKTKCFQQENLRITKTLRKEIVDIGLP